MRNLIIICVLINPFFVFGQIQVSNDTFQYSVLEILNDGDTLSIDSNKFKNIIVFNRAENILLIENPHKFQTESYFLNLYFSISSNDGPLEVYNDIYSGRKFYIQYTTTTEGKTISEVTNYEVLVTKDVPGTNFVEEYGISSTYK
jgi:hypothetical protein